MDRTYFRLFGALRCRTSACTVMQNMKSAEQSRVCLKTQTARVNLRKGSAGAPVNEMVMCCPYIRKDLHMFCPWRMHTPYIHCSHGVDHGLRAQTQSGIPGEFWAVRTSDNTPRLSTLRMLASDDHTSKTVAILST